VLPPATVTIAPFRVITCDLPGTRETTKATDKNNTLIIKIIKTIARTIVTVAPSELSLVTCLEQEPK
jgi:hypothetical protein